MIAAYEEKQQELRTLKKGKSKKSSKGSKKRWRQEENEASDEVCHSSASIQCAPCPSPLKGLFLPPPPHEAGLALPSLPPFL